MIFANCSVKAVSHHLQPSQKGLLLGETQKSFVSSEVLMIYEGRNDFLTLKRKQTQKFAVKEIIGTCKETFLLLTTKSKYGTQVRYTGGVTAWENCGNMLSKPKPCCLGTALNYTIGFYEYNPYSIYKIEYNDQSSKWIIPDRDGLPILDTMANHQKSIQYGLVYDDIADQLLEWFEKKYLKI